jgi:outer membrane protein OmpA-like peptidoglycan-associated protein
LRAPAFVAAVALSVGAAGVTSQARAAGPVSQNGFNVQTFEPSPRGSDWMVGDSLDLREDGRTAAGLVVGYDFKPFVVKNPDGSDRAAVVSHQLTLHPGGSLVLLDRLRLSLDFPIVVVDQGNASTAQGYSLDSPNSAALGDMSFAADVRLFGRYGEILTGALGLDVRIPTGSTSAYTGDAKTILIPRFSAAGVYHELAWAARLGMAFRTEDDPILGQSRGHALVFTGSVGWRPEHGKLVVGPEIDGAASLTSPSTANAPITLLFGAHYAVVPELRVGLGVGPGIGTGIGTPALRAAFSVEFVTPAEADRAHTAAPVVAGPPDRDHDSVADAIDACPDAPGPANIDPALNGCPPPADKDGDGIADPVDACPEETGSRNADPNLNGCPADADNDGIPDAEDACPLRAGVEQSDKRQNGCPPDSDRDGVVDADDACPDVPGAVSKDPQDNGCPFDADRDHDGIPNEADACPRDAGPKDADPKKSGCPKASLKDGAIQVLDPVGFDGQGAHLSTSAGPTLSAVVKVLIDHPELKKVEVAAHTDGRGDAKANKRLSLQRAQAVVKWLVSQGLDAGRFTAVGYGDEQPLGASDTEEGRAANRRIELRVTEGKP